jgi:hypothetical protein
MGVWDCLLLSNEMTIQIITILLFYQMNNDNVAVNNETHGYIFQL